MSMASVWRNPLKKPFPTLSKLPSVITLPLRIKSAIVISVAMASNRIGN